MTKGLQDLQAAPEEGWQALAEAGRKGALEPVLMVWEPTVPITSELCSGFGDVLLVA